MYSKESAILGTIMPINIMHCEYTTECRNSDNILSLQIWQQANINQTLALPYSEYKKRKKLQYLWYPAISVQVQYILASFNDLTTVSVTKVKAPFVHAHPCKKCTSYTDLD